MEEFLIPMHPKYISTSYELISENAAAEQKLLTHKYESGGRVDYFVLQELYEGVGANSKAVLASNKDIQ